MSSFQVCDFVFGSTCLTSSLLIDFTTRASSL